MLMELKINIAIVSDFQSVKHETSNNIQVL